MPGAGEGRRKEETQDLGICEEVEVEVEEEGMALDPFFLGTISLVSVARLAGVAGPVRPFSLLFRANFISTWRGMINLSLDITNGNTYDCRKGLLQLSSLLSSLSPLSNEVHKFSKSNEQA